MHTKRQSRRVQSPSEPRPAAQAGSPGPAPTLWQRFAGAPPQRSRPTAGADRRAFRRVHTKKWNTCLHVDGGIYLGQMTCIAARQCPPCIWKAGLVTVLLFPDLSYPEDPGCGRSEVVSSSQKWSQGLVPVWLGTKTFSVQGGCLLLRLSCRTNYVLGTAQFRIGELPCANMTRANPRSGHSPKGSLEEKAQIVAKCLS